MDSDFLARLVEVLKNAASPSNEIQQQVMRAVDEMSTRADFGAVLGVLLSTPEAATADIRQRAGLLLKTALTRGTVQASSPGLREAALRALADPEPIIRKTGGSILTTLVTVSKRATASDVLRVLLQMIFDPSPTVAHGAFDALSKICEDLVDMWRQASLSDAEARAECGPLIDDFMVFARQELVPRILMLVDQNKKMTLLNIFALNFLFFPNHPLEGHLSAYFQTLGQLAATEKDGATVSLVCKGLVYIAQHHPDMYNGSLSAVISFMLTASKSPEYSVRLDALQFWPVVVTNEDWIPVMQPQLNELLPVLLKNMVYSEEDYMNMDEGLLIEDDAAVPDRPEDIAPRFHKESHGKDEIEEEDEDDEPASTWGNEWTARKAAASALDHIATAYRDSILPCMLPLIEEKLKCNNWEFQESALLALGAIGHGCMQGLSPHLPSILQLLESISKSRKPLLRSISCWTISRFSAWVSFDTHRPTALPLVLSVILARMLDQNKRVQEAAVSAFVSLEEEVGMFFGDHLSDVVKALCAGLAFYQSKNLLILLDAIAGLFESVGADSMSKPEVVEALVPPIVTAFTRVNFSIEKQLAVSLFECLTAITTTVGSTTGIEALNAIVSRCIVVIQANVEAYDRITVSMSTEEKPDGDLLACTLDLLCGVLDGLSDASSNLVSRLNFIPLVCKLVAQFDFDSKLPLLRHYYSNTVKQCAFALLGDVAKTCSVLLSDEFVAPIIPTIVAYITIGPVLVSNNSSWAIGEIAMRKSSQFIGPHVDNICAALLSNLSCFDVGTRPIVRQNAAIALGRMGLVTSQKMVSSGCFAQMFEPWCNVMKKMRTDAEKLTAVKGFSLCIEASPSTAMSKEKLQALFELIASMFPPPATLEQSLRGIVLMYRQALGEEDWSKLWATFPIESQYRLNHAFGLNMPVSQHGVSH